MIRRSTCTLVVAMCAMLLAPNQSSAANTLPIGYLLDTTGACQVTGPPSSSTPLRPPQDLRVERSVDSGREHTDQTLTIDQPVIDVTRPLKPGDAFVCTLTVRNRKSTPGTYDIRTLGLVGSRTEQARLVDVDDPEIGATAANWVDPLVNSIKLKPEETAKIPVVITVPPDPPTGGVAASIQVITRPAALAAGETSQVGVTTGAAATLLLRVGGEGRARLAFHDQRTTTLRTNRASWTWRARLDNDGTLQAIPSGRLRVRSIFGRTVAKFDIRTRPLLPKGGTPVSIRWNSTPWIGVYRWDATADAAGDAKATSAKASGWIVAIPPWWIVVLVAIAAIAVITWPIVRRRRAWRAYLDDEAVDDDSDDMGTDRD